MSYYDDSYSLPLEWFIFIGIVFIGALLKHYLYDLPKREREELQLRMDEMEKEKREFDAREAELMEEATLNSQAILNSMALDDDPVRMFHPAQWDTWNSGDAWSSGDDEEDE